MMRGAREYAKMFTTGQYGKLYLEVGNHARGMTFHIYVLPSSEKYDNSKGDNTIEVYGVIGGHEGWTERYGWLHEGPWVDDFKRIVEVREQELKRKDEESKHETEKKDNTEQQRISELLSKY